MALSMDQIYKEILIMKNKEIDKLSPDELKNKLNIFKKDLFNIRFKRVNGQLEDTSKISD